MMEAKLRKILEYAAIVIIVSFFWYLISQSSCNNKYYTFTNSDSIALKTIDSLNCCISRLDEVINAMMQQSFPVRERIVYRNRFLNKNLNEEFNINIDTVYLHTIRYLDSMHIADD